jgi:pimeloyl-ACP methyl ester carboxylesterase
VLGALLLILLVGPFLVPIPPLDDTVTPRELADEDSRFATVNGIEVHYKEQGSGEDAIVLLHGFGASSFSWREVTTALSADGRVVAFDRPSAGLTQRLMPNEWNPADYAGGSPYSPEAQADLTVALLDELGIERAVLVGHSAGGSVAMLTALKYPERVEALVLVDPAIYTEGGPPAFVYPLLKTPQMRRLGPLVGRALGGPAGERILKMAWHDPSRITEEIRQGYRLPLRAENWDRALWELTVARRPLDLGERLDELTVPVLVVSGDDDRIVPTEESRRLAEEIAGADLALIEDAGHVPHEEQPAAFLEAVGTFLEGL